MRRSRFRLRLLLTVVPALLTACAFAPPADLAIVGAWVHDGRGLPPVATNVTIRGDRIASVGAERRAKRVVDARGQHLLPGLIDMHTHVTAVKGRAVDHSRYLKRGITTIRDLGGFADQVDGATAATKLRIVSAVATVNGAPNAEFHRVAKTLAEASAIVEQLANEGAAVIKIHRALSPDVLPAVIEAAHRRGLKVTGHIPLGLHPVRACEMGMDGIEHVGSLIEAYASAVAGAKQDEAVRYLLNEESAPLYRCLRDRGVTVTPTLVLYASIARARAGSRAIPQELRDFISSLQAITLRLHRHGVLLLAGSDSSALDRPAVEPGASLLEEIELLRAAGVAPKDLLHILGSNAARSLGIASDGRLIASGQRADMMLLPADPTAATTTFARPTTIIVAGTEQPPARISGGFAR